MKTIIPECNSCCEQTLPSIEFFFCKTKPNTKFTIVMSFKSKLIKTEGESTCNSSIGMIVFLFTAKQTNQQILWPACSVENEDITRIQPNYSSCRHVFLFYITTDASVLTWNSSLPFQQISCKNQSIYHRIQKLVYNIRLQQLLFIPKAAIVSWFGATLSTQQ